ncbi:semaphorin-1A [Agrilus planipennis]|uniref:Semaphorin-1A n=1 Tax=Agrilus planipennis TaxID=224129 RepID=A0A1W4X637_AGRPL|nr:semaphorin-1A [Agrilus planipennis]
MPVSRSCIFTCKYEAVLVFLVLHELIGFFTVCHAWLPDSSSKIVNEIGQVNSIQFAGNYSRPNHFTILNIDNDSVLIGGRNAIYNLSIYDLSERKSRRIVWHSSEADSQLCILKGKTDDDCQNYIRIWFQVDNGVTLICGTNSYKPLCRHYKHNNGVFMVRNEIDGKGKCPFDPNDNSTAIFSKGHLYTATVADFSAADPLIYREPQRTETSDLKQLNAPDFISSISYENFVFFFFRETAVEYINCGKIRYSRVARVCENDKGGPGPRQFREKWTSFLKARMNCSVPGEYPFYFDEIQSASDVVSGKYGKSSESSIIYGVFTTPSNAIGGSAICAYNMRDIMAAFEGSFKDQEKLNSNWLPIPESRVPLPRPGQCVNDSRQLPGNVAMFARTHSLMESAVPAIHGKPLLIRVSLQYRFTAINVDAQVHTVNDETFDILYIGTDDGRILKVVNVHHADSFKGVVISENTVFSNGSPVKQIKTAPGYGNVIAVTKDQVRLVNLNHCSKVTDCRKCVELQDPHCAWDTKKFQCVTVEGTSNNNRRSYLIQNIMRGMDRRCWAPTDEKLSEEKESEDDNIKNEIIDDYKDGRNSVFTNSKERDHDYEDVLADKSISGCTVRQRLHIVIIGSSLVSLFLGFIGGYIFSKKFHHQPQYPEAPFIEQHNHLERLSNPPNSFLAPKANKTVNLVVNGPQNSQPLKKDNLETNKDLNIASDGTLQKIKKTYI